MTRYFFITVLSVFVLFGCNQDELNRLRSQNGELNAIKNKQDSVLNDLLADFNEIENNLSIIKEKEKLVELNSSDTELQKDQKDRILGDVQLINKLLDDNKALIAKLNSKVNRSNLQVAEFKRLVERLNSQIVQKDSTITAMKDQLAHQDFKIAELNTKVDTLIATTSAQTVRIAENEALISDQTAEIKSKTAALNTVFYIVDEAKNLKDLGVLSKSLSKKVNADFPTEKFTSIDKTKTFSIPVGDKKPKILSAHPTDSYVLNEDDKGVVTSLEIQDPKAFWSKTKYLVIAK